MTAEEYLKSLIAGAKTSEIPIHWRELELLLILMKREKQ